MPLAQISSMQQQGLNDEIGQVVALEGGRATVIFDRKSACARCKACGMFAENQKKVAITLAAPRGVTVGDSVRLVMDSRYYLLSLALLYGLPCVALVGGVALGFALWGEAGQLGAAGLGLCLTVAVYLAVRTQDKRLARWRRGKLALERVERA